MHQHEDSKVMEGLEVSYYWYKSVNNKTVGIGTRTESGGSSITLELFLC